MKQKERLAGISVKIIGTADVDAMREIIEFTSHYNTNDGLNEIRSEGGKIELEFTGDYTKFTASVDKNKITIRILEVY